MRTFYTPLRISLTLAVGLLGTSLASAKHYKLFVLTGQSNSLGTTAGGEVDPTPGSDPGDAHIKFFWHNVADASTSLGDSGGVFTSLQEQQGGFYAGSATHWGPEMNMGRTFYRAGVRDFGIIKASRGGGGNTNWSKSSGGHMYTHVVNTVTAAATDLTNGGDTFEIVGLLYLQGESDSSGEAAIADTRLSELITNLRTDLPNAGSMHAVAGGIAAAGGNRNTVRSKQASLAAGDATISYFENLDLQGQLYDGLHFDKAAKLTIGERYAQAFFGAAVCIPNYGKLVFLGDSITQGGLGFPSYRYQIFKHLIDRSATYTFTGSVTGAYQFDNVAPSTPPYNGEVFTNVNVHEGHFGWRAFWENARVPLPANRRTGNLGEGTVLNWSGQATTYEVNSSGNYVPYPDPAAAGSGSTGVTYIPDTVSILIGINDLAEGTTPVQVRDDIATMIDQYRVVNPNIAFHVNYVLHTNQGAALQANVDATNALLQPMADAKNAALATSPVWVIDADTGFDPVSMTHDNVHPNTTGEIYVGDRIAAGLGLIETPIAGVVPTVPPHQEKGTLSTCFLGDEIFNGLVYINGWSEVAPDETTETLDGTVLNRGHINGAGSWLEGQTSSTDLGVTTWDTGNDGDWTFETRLKFNANPAGFVIWLGAANHRIIVDVYADRTQDNGNNAFNVAHDNLDGAFHDFRIVNDSGADKYHVWRDGERLTPVGGVAYDANATENRMILGDFTVGGFGNLYDVDIASICYDQSGMFLPPGADADGDGMPDAWEYEYFLDVTAAAPGGDEDGDGRTNLEEYRAGTNPFDASSRLEIEKVEGTGSVVDVTVPDTVVDREYVLLRSDDLGETDPWTQIGPAVAGNGGSLVFQDAAATPDERFYVVGARLP